jgi:23S rRNA (cytidine2498-2'-O)-methyltransferase
MRKPAAAPQKTNAEPGLALLAYCRPGFERDLARELQGDTHADAAQATDGAGFVVVPISSQKMASPSSIPRPADTCFARQVVLTHSDPIALTSNNRVNPIYDALVSFMSALGTNGIVDVWVEYPDTNDGKALSRAAKAIAPRLLEALESGGMLDQASALRAHVFLTPEKTAWVGLADLRRAADAPLGIPRLRMPHDAPSRSTLKLAEAFQVFLGRDEERSLLPDMRAVDLGAAPGGWTWQLIQRGVRVTAVDNGPLKGDLVDNAMVKHLRTDGFRYRPPVPVDWLVCDMVEQPVRIAKLVAAWLTEGHARYAIFNLKLPMKKRGEEVARCRAIVADALNERGKPFELRVRQLYHDREEVTGYVRLLSRKDQSASRSGSARAAHPRSAGRPRGPKEPASGPPKAPWGNMRKK